MSNELILFHSSILFKIKACSIANSFSDPKYLDATNLQIEWVESGFVLKWEGEGRIIKIG